MIYLFAHFHTLRINASLIIAIKRKGNYKFYSIAILLLCSLQSVT
jgi:hypothetical protein